MNKNIRVIDLFNNIVNGKEIPAKIKCKGKEFYFNKYERSIDFLYRGDKDGNGWLVVKDIALTDEVEILEDNTEEIEELDTDIHIDSFMDAELSFNKIAQEINKLGKAIKELRKEKE